MEKQSSVDKFPITKEILNFFEKNEGKSLLDFLKETGADSVVSTGTMVGAFSGEKFLGFLVTPFAKCFLEEPWEKVRINY